MKILICLGLLSWAGAATAMEPKPMIVEGDFYSEILGMKRKVRVYLPPSYGKDSARRYPVLYLQDGQNVFTTAGTNAAFGWGNWELDRTVDKLSRQGKMAEIIMVGIDCATNRYQEYRGSSTRAKTRSDPASMPTANVSARYAQFLIKELKPKIDFLYHTRKKAADTAVMGSSMGGICSLVLAWDHPKVFGHAASLSGAFQVENQEFLRRLQNENGKPKPIRIYLDSGFTDYTGGDDERAKTTAVASELKRLGWKPGKNLLHFVDDKIFKEPELEKLGVRRDKWKEAQTNQHNEFYWRQRAWRPLTFLFPPE